MRGGAFGLLVYALVVPIAGRAANPAGVEPTAVAATDPAAAGDANSEPREKVGKPPEEPPPRPEVTTLTEVGGVLTQRGWLRLEPALEYTHSSISRFSVNGVEIVPGAVIIGTIQSFQINRDSLVQSLTARYGFTNRIEGDLTVPGVYRNERIVNTIPHASTEADVISRSNSDYRLGDIEGGLHYQVNSGSGGWPFLVANLRAKSDTGRGPFDIGYDAQGVETQLATGSGYWSVNPSFTLIAPAGPAVLFGNLGYLWDLEPNVHKQISNSLITKVVPGDAISANIGIGLAVTEDLSFNLGFDYSFVRPTEITDITADKQGNLQQIRTSSSEFQVGSLQFGLGYRFSPHLSVQVNAAVGATRDAPDFRINLRVPISVALFD
jgi:hypothetical protein